MKELLFNAVKKFEQRFVLVFQNPPNAYSEEPLKAEPQEI